MPERTHPQQEPLRVVIAGGGVAALEALVALRRFAEERVSVELLAAEPQFWYRPLAVAEPFGLGEVHGLDLAKIADELGAELILGTLESVDAERSIAHTRAGGGLPYDMLLVATGAKAVPAVPGAMSFRGPADVDRFADLVRELESGSVRRIAFALPGAVAWPLPLYELALQTAFRVSSDTSAEVVLVTHEAEPLGIFGSDASAAVRSVLAERRIELVTASYPVSFEDGTLTLKPRGRLGVDRVVALPRLEGPRLRGLPHDAAGFIPTDAHGRVHRLSNVFAAGDATSFPIKQGGIATQQADAAAAAIAAEAGADVAPVEFEPVLRGLVLTGEQPLYLRAELTSAGEPYSNGVDPLWWPPAKIAGRYLAPFLAARAEAILAPTA